MYGGSFFRTLLCPALALSCSLSAVVLAADPQATEPAALAMTSEGVVHGEPVHVTTEEYREAARPGTVGTLSSKHQGPVMRASNSGGYGTNYAPPSATKVRVGPNSRAPCGVTELKYNEVYWSNYEFVVDQLATRGYELVIDSSDLPKLGQIPPFGASDYQFDVIPGSEPVRYMAAVTWDVNTTAGVQELTRLHFAVKKL